MQPSRVTEVAARLGVSGYTGYSLYQWMKLYTKPKEKRQQDADLQADNRRMKAELKRVSEERYILKMAIAFFVRGTDLGTCLSMTMRTNTRCGACAV